MTLAHVFLALACLALLGAIGVQNYLVPALRNETISSGLTGPYHWWLDGTYLVLAVALVMGFRDRPLPLALASIAGLALILTAATNTFHAFVDRITDGQHSLWHSRFTTVVFASALALEVAVNRSGPVALWGMTGFGLAAPGSIYGLTRRSDYAEKLAVLGICCWLITWAL